MAHPHAKLADAIAHPAEQQDNFGLGVIFRIPMREREDDLAVGRAETAGAVGHIQAYQGTDDPAQHQTAKAANKRLLVMGGLEEA